MLSKRTRELLEYIDETKKDEEVILEILERRHDIEIELRIALTTQNDHLKKKVREYGEKFLEALQALSTTDEIDLRDQNQMALFELSYDP